MIIFKIIATLFLFYFLIMEDVRRWSDKKQK